MENINQIESDILNKIKNVSDHNSYERIKTEIFEDEYRNQWKNRH